MWSSGQDPALSLLWPGFNSPHGNFFFILLSTLENFAQFQYTDQHTIQYTKLWWEKLPGQFSKTNVIHQYFTQLNSRSTKVAIINLPTFSSSQQCHYNAYTMQYTFKRSSFSVQLITVLATLPRHICLLVSLSFPLRQRSQFKICNHVLIHNQKLYGQVVDHVTTILYIAHNDNNKVHNDNISAEL